MSPEFFSHILDQVKQYTDYIYLHVQGEPLLHPGFEEIMDICDHAEVHVQLVTNGTLIQKHKNLYQHSSLRKISFSLQSVIAQQSNLVPEYLNQILSFCETASNAGHPICELRMWATDINSPLYDYCLSMLHRRYSFDETDRSNNYRLMENVYLSLSNSWEWPSENNNIISTTGTCHGAVDQIAILSNGTVVPCCLDADANVAFGNLRITSLSEILELGRYTQMVNGFRCNQIREPFCQKCSYRTRFDKH